jgi:hypothetical protein
MSCSDTEGFRKFSLMGTEYSARHACESLAVSGSYPLFPNVRARAIRQTQRISQGGITLIASQLAAARMTNSAPMTIASTMA